MGMRLLPKSELDRAKAEEKKREVDEGIKLARTVDNLRELRVAEEMSLENFRRETVANIHEQITTESKKLEKLLTEVKTLEERRNAALKPLDEAKRLIEEASKEVERSENSAREREKRLAETERVSLETTRAADSLLERVRTKDTLSDARLLEIEENRIKTKNLLSEAENTLNEAREEKRMISVELTHREELVIAREESATMKETDLATREKQLADGWSLLRDREATFIRSKEREK